MLGAVAMVWVEATSHAAARRVKRQVGCGDCRLRPGDDLVFSSSLVFSCLSSLLQPPLDPPTVFSDFLSLVLRVRQHVEDEPADKIF